MELRFAPRSVSPKFISSISSSHDGDSWTFREQFRVSRVQGEEGKSLEFHLGARFHFPTSFPERRRCPLAPGSSRVGWGEKRRCHSHPLLFPVVMAPATLPTHRHRAGSAQPDSGRARTSHGGGVGGTHISAVRPGALSCI